MLKQWVWKKNLLLFAEQELTWLRKFWKLESFFQVESKLIRENEIRKQFFLFAFLFTENALNALLFFFLGRGFKQIESLGINGFCVFACRFMLALLILENIVLFQVSIIIIICIINIIISIFISFYCSCKFCTYYTSALCILSKVIFEGFIAMIYSM